MKRESSHSDSSHDKICNIEEELNTLTSDATVACSKCGAKAHDPASLCSPVKLTGSSQRT